MTKKTAENSHLKNWALATFGSVNEFARAMNIGQSAASQLLNGYYEPGLHTLKKLNALGYPLDELLKLEEQIKAKGGYTINNNQNLIKEPEVHFFAPSGLSNKTKAKYKLLAKLLEDVSPDDIETIATIVEKFVSLKPKGKK